VLRAFVGRPIRAERAPHRDAVVLVQEILAARRDVDHQHVAVRGHAGLREWQAVRRLLRQPRPQRLELDRHGAAASIVDQEITLRLVTLHVPRRIAVAQDADLGAVRRVDEVGDRRDAPAGRVVLPLLESVGVVIGHRVQAAWPSAAVYRIPSHIISIFSAGEPVSVIMSAVPLLASTVARWVSFSPGSPANVP